MGGRVVANGETVLVRGKVNVHPAAIKLPIGRAGGDTHFISGPANVLMRDQIAEELRDVIERHGIDHIMGADDSRTLNERILDVLFGKREGQEREPE